MKNVLCVILAAVLALMLTGCNGKMTGMPKYESKEEYFGEGFQDYTDYCKYYYSESKIKEFETHSKFKKVSVSDIEEIRSYFENFEEWVKFENYREKYDFDDSVIKEGDYYYIFEKAGYPKYGYYDVYYVDMDQRILYFIHSDI